MLTLFSVFSDHALFQEESRLTLRGLADAGAVCTAAIRAGGKIFSEGSAAVGASEVCFDDAFVCTGGNAYCPGIWQ